MNPVWSDIYANAFHNEMRNIEAFYFKIMQKDVYSFDCFNVSFIINVSSSQ